MNKQKLLIFIVTYNAQRHIESVLERIPETFWNGADYETEILIIDDASTDETISVCQSYRNRTGKKFTLLKNPFNQGYGGNQKIGYTYAIKNNFDFVALLHGDGQYPPEMIADLITPLAEGKADACFGSRMLYKNDALKGGMPAYKFIGNIILTRLQNSLVGTALSEFHSGFRAYRVSALAGVPFSYNSDDFDFDTDIIIQLAHNGKTITEIAIPTHYGDEVCHVNGLRYARQIIRTSILSKLQRFQIYYHPKFDFEGEKVFYPSKTHFDSAHSWAVNQINNGATVIDIGLASGAVAAALHEQKSARIIGFYSEINPEAARYCISSSEINFDKASFSAPIGEKIDYVLLIDVLERLSNPEIFLANLREQLSTHNSKIIIATANVGFVIMRLSLLFGRFNYGKRGILDFTHKRLFTFRSLKRILTQQGFIIEQIAGIPVPMEFLFSNRRSCRIALTINRWLMRISRSLFSFQIVTIARPKPTLQHLLASAIRQ